jgi:hypothetical protein
MIALRDFFQNFKLRMIKIEAIFNFSNRKIASKNNFQYFLFGIFLANKLTISLYGN